MKSVKAIIRYLLFLLVSVLVGVAAFSANASALAGNALPMPFGYGVSVVMSGSMEPSISVNDLIIVQQRQSYSAGDVVVYQSGRLPIVHRILSIDGDAVTTKGDANNVPDEPFPLENIRGAVIAVIPSLGLLFRAIKTPVGIVLTLALALVLMELSFRDGKSAEKKRTEEIKEEINRLKRELEASGEEK